MSEASKVRCSRHVERPYPEVRRLLRERPRELFQRATTSAVQRADAVGASLHASAAGIEVGVDVHLHVQALKEEAPVAGLSPVAHFVLGWEAAHAPGFFPVMRAEVSLWPVTSSETAIEIEGEYRPPLGLAGRAIDAAAGHRVAEVTVQRFVDDLAAQLCRELPESRESATS